MSVELIWIIMEHLGVIAFAISGAIVAIDHETDIFGVVFLSFITSFGGGIIRDLILNRGIPSFFTRSYTSLIIVCFVTSLAVFFFAMIFKKRFIENEKLFDYINNYVDAVGIGSFTVSGAKIAMDAGHVNAFVPILMGMIACIGGGMIRDILLNEVPFVLKKRIYALATAAGAAIYYVIYTLSPENGAIAMIIGALSTITIRLLATIFKWNMPKAIRFSEFRSENGDENKK